ncbi:FkbM family methyltransferase [Brachyspira hyodysenteriae]|uniref:FkbM family methyltransferase n=1 Tax=Brachyspira hyodysenteriae TaxID=159 RepID=UPI000A1640A9|nr:FkbM family methyltransferase [Brachyspira hyodysenteriae]
MNFNIRKIYHNEINKINNLIDKNTRIAFFGAGAYGKLCLSYMQENNYNVVCFIDNDKNKQDSYIENIPIISMNTIFEYDIILITSFSINIIDEILKYKVNKPIISFNKWFIFKNIDLFTELRNILYDDKSIEVLDSLLYSKIENDNKAIYNIYEDKQYFAIPEFLYSKQNEIFLDAGAYVGDTIDKFINYYSGSFHKIYAFEPGEKQFKAIVYRIDRLIKEWAINKNNIIVQKSGLSNYNGEVYFDETTQIAVNSISKINTNNKVELTTIDSFLKGSPITFLKADIEGEELNMLKGAVNTIKKYKPKMAISVYHKPNDLLTIPSFIKKLVPEYNLALRHHSTIYADTILYCWPDQTRPDQTRPDQTRPDQTRNNM